MKPSVILLFLTIYTVSFGQLVQEFDTLSFHERMNGGLDSIDIAGADIGTTFDGGRSILSPDGLSPQRLFENYTTPSFMSKQKWDEMSFSALPHLGFSYSFGSQSSQFLKARYEQSFSDSLILNIDYKRTSGLGAIRNANFNTDNVSLQFQKQGRVYSFSLRARFVNEKINHPGGVTTDTLIKDYGLEFTPVHKQNAFSQNKQGTVEWNNYFDLTKDSLLSFGVVTKHEYQIKNRIYTEEDSVHGLYPNVYIDSFSTRDQYNLAEIRNGAGVYWMSKGFYIDAVADYNYWEYHNLGNHKFRNEISLHSDAYLELKKLNLKNEFYFNIHGAFNEFSNKSNAEIILNPFVIRGDFTFEKLAPTAFQRFYNANNVQYAMNANDLKLQQWTKLNVNAKYMASSKINVEMFTSLISLSSIYLFDGVKWNLENTKRTISRVGLSSEIKWGVLNVHPRFVYSFDAQDFLPNIQASSRIFLQGKVFKAKKLEIAGGVDVMYTSSFTNRTYNSLIDTYDFYTKGNDFTDMVNMNAFINLGMSEFRFFLRFENIGYFWTPKEQTVVTGYPIADTRLRVGLTWDFFN